MPRAKGQIYRSALDRLFDRIAFEPNSGCWLWEGCLSAGTYGSMLFDGRMQKTHRVAYQLFVGPVPEGMDLDHLCRTRICCNPDHLEPVTRAENLRRSPLMDRNSMRTHCIRGHEFTPENTMTRPNGWRTCRECMRNHIRAWRARNAKAA
jgi:hypothetical protein